MRSISVKLAAVDIVILINPDFDMIILFFEEMPILALCSAEKVLPFNLLEILSFET
jgi:hypothetical protein